MHERVRPGVAVNFLQRDRLRDTIAAHARVVQRLETQEASDEGNTQPGTPALARQDLGGPGSGPHSSESARTPEQHAKAAKYHEKQYNDHANRGNGGLAQTHARAADAHAKAANEPSEANSSAARGLSGMASSGQHTRLASWEDDSTATTDEGKSAEVARSAEQHHAAARYHAGSARADVKAGNTSRASAHQHAASAHLRAAEGKNERVSTAANIASAEAHATGVRKRAVADSEAETQMLGGPGSGPHAAGMTARGHDAAAEGHKNSAMNAGINRAKAKEDGNTAKVKAFDAAISAHYKAAEAHENAAFKVAENPNHPDAVRMSAGAVGHSAYAHSMTSKAHSLSVESPVSTQHLGHAASAHLRAAEGKNERVSTAANIASAEAHATGVRKRAVAMAEFDGGIKQTLDIALPLSADIDGKIIPDEELPADLRRKGLVRGQRFEYMQRGLSTAKDGRVFLVDDRAVQSLLDTRNSATQPAPFDFSHRKDPLYGADTSGYFSTMSADPKSVWVESIAWTRTAADAIATGKRGFTSPEISCEPLDPVTFATLSESSPLYDEATGHYNTNTWRPMVALGGGLVPNPALPNIPTVTLSTNDDPPAKAERKENVMNPELLKFLGLPSTATKAQIKQALDARGVKTGMFRQALADGAAADGGGGGGLGKSDIIAMFRKAYKLPDIIDDETLCDLICDKLMGEPAPEPKPAVAADMAPEPVSGVATMAAKPAATVQVLDMEAVAKRAAAINAEQMATDAEAKRVDAILLQHETSGALVPARRDEFRARLLNKQLAEGAVIELNSLANGGASRFSQIVGTGNDPSISVDRLPTKQANEILSRAAGFMFEAGCSWDEAFKAVRSGNAEEAAFHREVLAIDPDWGIPFRERSNRSGVAAPVRVRKTTPGMRRVEMDTDMAKHVQQKLASGAFREFFEQAASKSGDPMVRQLLSDVGNFQPGGKFTVPNMAFGVMQGDYAQPEICPDITGGPNEEVSIPIYSTEALQAPVDEDGYPSVIAYNAKDIPTTSLNVAFQKVVMKGSANKVDVDRRGEKASLATLPEGFLATATKQALTIEKNKREIWVSKLLRTSGAYNAGNQFDLSAGSRGWHIPESTPLQDNKKADVILWRAVGKFSDGTLIPPDVLAALQYHPDFIRAAQIAFQGQGQSGAIAYVPESLIAMFLGPIMVPTARISTSRGGGGADTLWGQDVIKYISSKGEVIAPRAFGMVVSPGYPIVKTFPKEEEGLDGLDVVKVSDLYGANVIGVGNNGSTITTPTQSAYLFQNAAQKITNSTM